MLLSILLSSSTACTAAKSASSSTWRLSFASMKGTRLSPSTYDDLLASHSCSLFIEIYHSLIQQQGRNLMELHGIFVQFVDLFPFFPSSLNLRSFLMTHLQVLGLELCAVDLGSHPPTPWKMWKPLGLRVEATADLWRKIPHHWSYSFPFEKRRQKIWWRSFCHFFLLSSSLGFFPALTNQHVFYFLI